MSPPVPRVLLPGGAQRAAVRVVTADEAAARDRAAIDAGVPPRALMQRAGAAAAAEIARRVQRRLARGVAIYAGPGNNGGDAWVVAGALGAAGIAVRVVPVGAPRTDDARAERESALPFVESDEPDGAEEVVVDGLLGTGAKGAPRGEIAAAIAIIAARRARGALVVALDVPSGIDATSGVADSSVRADLTLTFGTMKRGLLVARADAGRIAVLDIGLGAHAALADEAPTLADARSVLPRVPAIVADAHKGARGRIAIVGGAPGMAGAAALAARAALRSGAGLVKLVIAPESLTAVQAAVPQALAASWPEPGELIDWADALLIGPGLGRTDETRAMVGRLLRDFRGPVVLDADALNVYEGEAAALGALLEGRPALVTPHPAEFARLAGITVRDVLDGRFDVGRPLARTLRATVLLKGVPTIVTDHSGARVVSAAGTPALATGGSGDLLGGIAATLLVQTRDPFAAGGCAAWVHGRAAELATARRSGATRGVALEDVERALGDAWRPLPGDTPGYPVLAELPAVGDAAQGGL